ncbi:hypothetical protein DRN74_04220 [Candidatus Micrarchaeota archaeon]|nr:MAG: hypothetical protein DRN74_04220 [Candidatus Micrarchaeota archaeon]
MRYTVLAILTIFVLAFLAGCIGRQATQAPAGGETVSPGEGSTAPGEETGVLGVEEQEAVIEDLNPNLSMNESDALGELAGESVY